MYSVFKKGVKNGVHTLLFFDKNGVPQHSLFDVKSEYGVKTHLWAHDPRSAQDGSTSSEKCTPAVGCSINRYALQADYILGKWQYTLHTAQCIACKLPTIEECMSVEFIKWYWTYSANNWGDICLLEVSLHPLGAGFENMHSLEYVHKF